MMTSSDAAPVEYAVAVERFLAESSLSDGSRRVYRISLTGWSWPLVGQPSPAGPAAAGQSRRSCRSHSWIATRHAACWPPR